VGTVAIVTGRPVAEAVRLGRLQDVDGIVVLGHYGIERYEHGRVDSPGAHDGVERLRPRLAELARDGVRLEDKGHSLALHTRNAPDPQGSLEGLGEPVAALAAEVGLEVVPGRFVLEVRPPGVDKGGALRSLVQERGASAVLFAGDDLGDLPAVRTVHELRAGGIPGIVVCSDSAETPAALRDQADLLVDGPQGVVELLAALADALGR
jgi:trehalose 6-phosphate phosphatase